ncbi:uncharacterized protein MONBRDRAFT_29416 [Monosiga brevicollis MX1]|uniref:Tubulin/FtsZ GTPase domain-containing protein n=1 Tax=Monosiga brevicollis TaxID=81824 RepID=A9VB11_MONBE|nr:uncharacterized protein MONBRDRAFT_29416 [Monosiga brevicollis MX1]EDQ85258.1 predicted protein [Monosiga brevicollis MX1]|eukprot:XP_001749879.1 hypothetical protein [Monosiga brevicollis MX1]
MTQSIVVQVGQCGNQIGAQFWQRALEEHAAINSQGTFDEAMNTFFENVDTSVHPPRRLPVGQGEQPIATLRARAVLVDMEEGVVNGLQRGPLGELFDRAHCVTSVSGSGNNWAVGYHQYGAQYGADIEQAVRRAAEACDCLQSFLLLHSMGGGTGSGLGTWLVEMLHDAFPDVYRFVVPVYPSEVSLTVLASWRRDDDVITSPYNCSFATHQLKEFADCVLPVENQALADIVANIDTMSKGKLKAKSEVDGSGSVGENKRPWRRMNSIVAKMLLDMTSGSRFPGSVNVDVNELTMNLVPFPKMHFVTSSLSPLYDLADVHVPPRRLDQMFTDAFDRSFQLLRSDPRRGLFSACTLMLRGDVEMSDVRRNVDRMKQQLRFADWNPDGWKIGMCRQASVRQSRSLLCLANNTCIRNSFVAVRDRFLKLYRKRAFKHHFTSEGMDQGHFDVALNSLNELAAQYANLEAETPLASVTRPQLL